jgi:hypothetical protein
MAQHNITVIATAKTDTTASAVTGPDGGVDVIDITEADTVAVVTAVGDVLGVKLDGIDGIEAGDTIVVTGSVGRIPDYQVGMALTVDVDGWAHLVNAGAIANALS